MFIDVQVHAYRAECPVADGTTKFATAEEVLRVYDEFGIDMGFVQPLIGPEVYLPQSNEDIIDICAASGGRLLPFCNIDPRGLTNAPNADFSIWLDHYKARGCIGVGEVMPNLPFLDPRCQNFFAHVERSGLPMTFDISDRVGGDYGFYDDPGLPQLEATLKRFPKLIIVGHGPAFWSEIGALDDINARGGYVKGNVKPGGAVPRLFRENENLVADLSAGSGYNALARDPEHAADFLEEFQDKLMFGTDLCSPETKPPLPAFLRELEAKGKISKTTFEKIARGNAVRIYKLGDGV